MRHRPADRAPKSKATQGSGRPGAGNIEAKRLRVVRAGKQRRLRLNDAWQDRSVPTAGLMPRDQRQWPEELPIADQRHFCRARTVARAGACIWRLPSA